jgi:hypothetical protein
MAPSKKLRARIRCDQGSSICVGEYSKDVVNVFNLATDDTFDVTSIAKIVIEEMELKRGGAGLHWRRPGLERRRAPGKAAS